MISKNHCDIKYVFGFQNILGLSLISFRIKQKEEWDRNGAKPAAESPVFYTYLLSRSLVTPFYTSHKS